MRWDRPRCADDERAAAGARASASKLRALSGEEAIGKMMETAQEERMVMSPLRDPPT